MQFKIHKLLIWSHFEADKIMLTRFSIFGIRRLFLNFAFLRLIYTLDPALFMNIYKMRSSPSCKNWKLTLFLLIIARREVFSIISYFNIVILSIRIILMKLKDNIACEWRNISTISCSCLIFPFLCNTFWGCQVEEIKDRDNIWIMTTVDGHFLYLIFSLLYGILHIVQYSRNDACSEDRCNRSSIG